MILNLTDSLNYHHLFKINIKYDFIKNNAKMIILPWSYRQFSRRTHQDEINLCLHTPGP